MVVNIDDSNQYINLLDHFEELKTFYRIHVPFKSFKELMEENDIKKVWCEEHCKDDFYSYHSIWYFKDEQDYLMFILRWAK